MKATDQLLTAVLILANRANKQTFDETILAFEDAGLVTHTYVPADWQPGLDHDCDVAGCSSVEHFPSSQEEEGQKVRIDYNFTPKFQALVEGI